MSKSFPFILPLHFQLPGSSDADSPSPGADLSSAVCDSLPTSEPSQCHPRGQINQACFLGSWYVYSEKIEHKWLAWTLQAVRFIPHRHFLFMSMQHGSVFSSLFCLYANLGSALGNCVGLLRCFSVLSQVIYSLL